MARLWIAFCFGTAAALAPKAAAESISYWDTPRHGTNLIASSADGAQLAEAKRSGAKLIRLSPSFWSSKHTDFLLGDAFRFTQLKDKDLESLFQVLTQAHEQGMRVVLTLHTLPGLRRSLDGSGTRTLWTRRRLTDKAIDFWRQMATALRGHPGLAGYYLVDEPRPELVSRYTHPTESALRWIQGKRGTPADLNAFYQRVVKSIRSVDGETPILVESGFGASPEGFPLLRPIDDAKVLYSFHLPSAGKNAWTRTELEKALGPVSEWQKKHHVASNRIFVGAFAIEEALAVFKEKGWHTVRGGEIKVNLKINR